jgi:hypothetical protein
MGNTVNDSPHAPTMNWNCIPISLSLERNCCLSEGETPISVEDESYSDTYHVKNKLGTVTSPKMSLKSCNTNFHGLFSRKAIENNEAVGNPDPQPSFLLVSLKN